MENEIKKDIIAEIKRILGDENMEKLEELHAIVPEPVCPVELFKLSLQNRRFEQRELEILLRSMEKDLDECCETAISSTRISWLEYAALFYESGRLDKGQQPKYFGEVIIGGFHMNARGIFLPELQRDYKKSFKKIPSEYAENPMPIDADVYMIGFRDFIPVEVPIKNSNEAKNP